MNKMTGVMAQSWLVSRRLGFKGMRHRSNLLLAFCVFISAMVASTLGFFSSSVNHSLNQDVASFLGADVVVRSRQALPDEWWQSSTQQTPVTTVAISHGAIGPGGYHSVSLKAIDDQYPLQGALQLQIQGSAKGTDLRSGEAWLDARAMHVLGAEVGDRIQMGQVDFLVTDEILLEPDRLTQFQHVLPRVMIKHADLAAVGLDLNNGMAEYRYLFSLAAQLSEDFSQQLKQQQKVQIQVMTPKAGQHPFSRLVLRAENLLGMVTVLVLILCGGAAAMLASDSMKRYVYPSAMLRCFGVSRRCMSLALLMQLGLITLVCSLLGSVCAWLIQPWLAWLLEPHLQGMEPIFLIQVPLFSLVLTLSVLLAFVYPQLRQLNDLAPASILRGQFEVQANWAQVTVLAVALVLALLWYFSDNPRLTAYLVMGVVLVLVSTWIFGRLMNALTAWTHHFTTGPLRVVLRSVGRNPGKHVVTMATIGIAVMAFTMTSVLRSGFMDTYQVNHLNHDGNVIFNGLDTKDQLKFEQLLETAQAELKSIHPVVNAMLVTINGQPIDQVTVHESESREELRSPVRLSFSEQMPQNNRLLNGHWPNANQAEVSVESEVMTDMGLQLGDVLGFQIGSDTLTARIVSERVYRGGGSRFMFWFMFGPGVLDAFQPKRMGGFLLNAESKSLFQSIQAQLPSVRLIRLEQQLSRMRAIMNTMTNVMNGIMLMLLAAASTVLLASAYVYHRQNKNRWTLLRAMGLRQGQQVMMLVLEHAVIACVACLIGVLIAELMASVMFESVFAVDYHGDLLLYLIIGSTVVGGFALLGWILSQMGSKQTMLRGPGT